MSLPRQSSLPLEPRDSGGSLVVGDSNRAAVEAVLAQDWNGVLYLEGPAGSGKTTMARAWSAHARAEFVSAQRLDLALAAKLVATEAVGVDGLEDLPAGEGEEALFHLLNARLRQGCFLLTSQLAPGALRVALPDLRTRIRALTPVLIDAPDDDLLIRLLMALADRRQLALPEALARFLLSRMGRSYQSAINLVEALDRLSLARGSPLTRELAAEALETTNS